MMVLAYKSSPICSYAANAYAVRMQFYGRKSTYMQTLALLLLLLFLFNLFHFVCLFFSSEHGKF